MRILLLLILLLFFNSTALKSQTALSWDQLALAQWNEKEDSLGHIQMIAEFEDELEALNGNEVIISGYVIPLDAMGFAYALSANSFAACFFCGQAGPETVMELKVTPKSIKSYEQKTELLRFKGTLVLKSFNPLGLNYILKDAKRIRE